MDARVKKYRKKLKYDFKEVKTDEITDYGKLISEIENQYKDVIQNDLHKLFLEKIKIQDKINSSKEKSIKDIVLAVCSMVYSVFIVIIGKLDSIDLMNVASWLLKITYIIAGIFIANAIITNSTYKYRDGYNQICLRVLEKMEKEIGSYSEVKIQNDLNNIKRFIGI